MFPNTLPRPETGAPRSDFIEGWFGGNPTDRGSALISGIEASFGDECPQETVAGRGDAERLAPRA